MPVVKTNRIVNWPVVPFGSTAKLKYGGSQKLVMCWYKDSAAAYFNFDEAPITATTSGDVPIADLFVMFNDNNAGSSSAFKTEPGTTQIHNITDSSPGDPDYSPLWQNHVIDNAGFSHVTNLATAQNAHILNPNIGLVNCPIVK